MADTSLSRRSFVKTAGALGAAAAVSGSLATGEALLGNSVPQALAEGEEERIVWSHCHVNCGGACVLRFHMQGDEIKNTSKPITPGATNSATSRCAPVCVGVPSGAGLIIPIA